MRELFGKHLFGTGSAEDKSLSLPVCKKDPTRRAAFALLLEACNDNGAAFGQLIRSLIMFHQQDAHAQRPWNYSPALMERAPSGYVGLKNLGATCYMNSITQQFFMIPGFRQAILESESKEADQENSLLYQLQSLFVHLQESEQKAYDTSPFCLSFKDYEGKSMNTSVQMDADEYFNMLFDKLESLVKGSSTEVPFPLPPFPPTQ